MTKQTPMVPAALTVADLSDIEADRVRKAIDAACRLVEAEPHRAIPAVAALLLIGRPGSRIMHELFLAESAALGGPYTPKKTRKP